MSSYYCDTIAYVLSTFNLCRSYARPRQLEGRSLFICCLAGIYAIGILHLSFKALKISGIERKSSHLHSLLHSVEACPHPGSLKGSNSILYRSKVANNAAENALEVVSMFDRFKQDTETRSKWECTILYQG